MLCAKQLTKYYKEQRVLDCIDLSLSKGETVVVLGPSGSGKSTLLRLMSLLEPPTSGTIELEGRLLTQAGAIKGGFSPWPKVTVVFQQHFLWPHLSLYDNIMLPVRKSSDETTQEKLLEYVSRFAMNDCIDRFPNQASIGQRQRAAIIRALMLKPEYLLLDEITSALDVEQAGEILRFFLEAWKGQFAALFVTHHLGFARSILRSSPSSKAAFIVDGKLIESGDASILESPKSERLSRFLDAAKLIN